MGIHDWGYGARVITDVTVRTVRIEAWQTRLSWRCELMNECECDGGGSVNAQVVHTTATRALGDLQVCPGEAKRCAGRRRCA